LATLVDRLSNRLGAHAVVRPWLLAGAQPEFACQYQPVASLKTRRKKRPSKPGPFTLGAAPASKARQDEAADLTLSKPRPGDRPLLLEPRPQPLAVISVAPNGPPVQFRLAGAEHRIEQIWGPERIETGWWRGRCVRRDYYQVETAAGDRYWLFRELNSGQWFLHARFL
jgi:protein ImuB